MNSKIKTIYVFTYLLLNIIGVSLAFKFWWTDSLILSGLNKFTLILLFSIGISWIGILFISLMLSRMLILKSDEFNFVSPFRLLSNEYFRTEIGINKALKLKKTISLIAFPILILTIVSFIFLINIYENYQLKKYGVIETVFVKEIHHDIKQNEYAFIEYHNKKYSTNLYADSLKINQKTKIIYSKKNPNIVKYLKEYEKE